jgi:hypothetical protein
MAVTSSIARPGFAQPRRLLFVCLPPAPVRGTVPRFVQMRGGDARPRAFPNLPGGLKEDAVAKIFNFPVCGIRS